MATSVKDPWKGIAILADDSACAAAKKLHGKRFLSRSPPRLPLAECTQQNQCQCKYRHLRDRRGPPRRDGDEGTGLRAIKKTVTEQRRPGERREPRR